MKKYLTIFSIFIVLILLYFIGVFDRLNITSNRIEIINKCNKPKITEALTVTFPNYKKMYDTLIIYQNNTLIKETVEDWYGKAHIEVIYNNKKFIHGFNTYKFKSWHKTFYKLTVEQTDINKLYLYWEVKTIWKKNTGVDTINLINQIRNEK